MRFGRVGWWLVASVWWTVDSGQWTVDGGLWQFATSHEPLAYSKSPTPPMPAS